MDASAMSWLLGKRCKVHTLARRMWTEAGRDERWPRYASRRLAASPTYSGCCSPPLSSGSPSSACRRFRVEEKRGHQCRAALLVFGRQEQWTTLK